MEIRVMKIEDYDQVFQLWNETAGMGMRSLDDSREGIEKFIQRNPKTNFVAMQDGQLLGVIMAGNDGRRAYIYHTAVAMKARRKGVASKLLAACLQAIKDEGINKVALVVFGDNQLGNDFWQAQGFEVRNDIIYRNLTLTEQTGNHL